MMLLRSEVRVLLKRKDLRPATTLSILVAAEIALALAWARSCLVSDYIFLESPNLQGQMGTSYGVAQIIVYNNRDRGGQRLFRISHIEDKGRMAITGYN